MSIVDPDSNDVITATINAASGVSLSVNGTNATGATITAISANQMVVSGSAAQVNSAIDLLQASATSAGSQTISLSASDGISSSSANLTMNVTPNAPGAPAVISAISSGVSASELSSGFDLTISLLGTGAKVGDTLKIYGANAGGSNIVLAQKTLSIGDLSATQISLSASGLNAQLSVQNLASFGVDGNKAISAAIVSSGLESPLSSSITVNLDRTAPVFTSAAP
jgi:hypothetical protein